MKGPKVLSKSSMKELPLKDPSVPICSQTGRGVGDFRASYHAREAETKVGTRGRDRACTNCLIGLRRGLQICPLSIWKLSITIREKETTNEISCVYLRLLRCWISIKARRQLQYAGIVSVHCVVPCWGSVLQLRDFE